MRIINQTRDKLVASQTILANTFLSRLKGLLGRQKLDPGQALALYPCSSVHTWFMKFAIDVVFLNSQGAVIHLQENLAPWRCSPIIRGAVTVVELPAGGIRSGSILMGDTLVFEDIPHGGIDHV